MADSERMQAGGWMGRVGQVLHTLRVYGADQDEEGKFLVSSGGVSTFMGMQGEDADCVVSASALYRKDGQWCSLAQALNSTSYGLKVTVIG